MDTKPNQSNDINPYTILCDHLRNYIDKHNLKLIAFSFGVNVEGQTQTQTSIEISRVLAQAKWRQIHYQTGTLFITPDEIAYYGVGSDLISRRHQGAMPIISAEHQPIAWEDPDIIYKLENILDQMNTTFDQIMSEDSPEPEIS
jgi:hypothetical protein